MMHAGFWAGDGLLVVVAAVIAMLAIAALVLYRARRRPTLTAYTDAMLVSDRDREQAIATLSSAYTSGRLAGADLESRTEEALKARTRAHLDKVVGDIPTGADSTRQERRRAIA